MKQEDLSGLTKLQVAYSHFTLEEWHLLVLCVRQHAAVRAGTLDAFDPRKVNEMLAKFPSAVL